MPSATGKAIRRWHASKLCIGVADKLQNTSYLGNCARKNLAKEYKEN